MKTFFLFMLSLILLPNTFSNDNNRRFKVYNYSGFEKMVGHTALLPQYDVSYIGDDINNDYNEISLKENGRYEGRTLAGYGGSLGFQFRYNFIEMSKNSSVSGSVIPIIGISGASVSKSDDFGLGHISLPVLIEFNYGTEATVSYTKNSGVSAGVGVEYYVFPLYINYERYYNSTYRQTENYSYKRNWIQPIVTLTYKKLNNKGNYIGVMLKAGMGPKTSYTNTAGSAESIRSYTIGCSLITNLKKNTVNYSNKKNKQYRHEDIQF